MPRIAVTRAAVTGEARFSGTARPARRAWHATTELDHFVLVTYRVATAALASTLPDGFVPEVFTFDDGTSGSLVSAVPFVDRDFRFRGMPLVTMSCGQVNYRAYVTFGGERGVYFLGTSLDSSLVALPRLLWRMPWHHDRIAVDMTDRIVRFTGVGTWGSGHLVARVTGERFGRLDGFASSRDTAQILTHPMVGWYRRQTPAHREVGRVPRLGRYEVWHPPVDAVVCEPRRARFEVFERLGLVSPTDAPHSVLYQPSIHFDVLTPPRALGA